MRQNETAPADLAHSDLAQVREQVGVLAEQVGRLIDVITRQGARGQDTRLAEDKLEVLETLMWKLHRRQSRLRTGRRVLN